MKIHLERIALLATVTLISIGTAVAGEWDKKTTITVDEAMQVPNTTLQPGTYVIKLADLGSSRHIVQIFDKDEKHVVTTILAIPNERLKPTGKSVFTFWEVPAGQPKALRAWFYPGDNFGQEFAYPKSEGARISASNAGAKVPESEEKPADLAQSVPQSTTQVSANSAAPATTEPVETPAPTQVASDAHQSAPIPAPVATREEPAQQAPTTVASDSDAQRISNPTPAAAPAPTQELPKTGSNVPLVGLIGIIALAGALMLKLGYHRV